MTGYDYGLFQNEIEHKGKPQFMLLLAILIGYQKLLILRVLSLTKQKNIKFAEMQVGEFRTPCVYINLNCVNQNCRN